MRTRRSWRNQERLWRILGGIDVKVRKPRKTLKVKTQIIKIVDDSKPVKQRKNTTPLTAWVDKEKVVHWYDEEGMKHYCAQYKENPATLTDHLVSVGFILL